MDGEICIFFNLLLLIASSTDSLRANMNIKKIIGFVGVCSVCVLTAHADYFQYPSFSLYTRLTEDGGKGNVIPKTYEKLLKALHDGGFKNGEFDGNIEKNRN